MPFGADARGRLAVLPAFVLVVPFQCSLRAPVGLAPIARSAAPSRQIEPPRAVNPPRREPEPVGPSAATPKQEEPAPRIASVPPPPVRAATLPAAVVLAAMNPGQQAFIACWAHAQRSAEPPSSSKLQLHLELDDQGRVTAARSDSDSPALERCVARVARGLTFPAPGQPAVVDVPLLFR
jgi:hypothetical protein